ncbi:hypothetical protein U1Q18_025463 [Sarracenia purpurea var. burkii]
MDALDKAKQGRSPLNNEDMEAMIEWLAWYRGSPNKVNSSDQVNSPILKLDFSSAEPKAMVPDAESEVSPGIKASGFKDMGGKVKETKDEGSDPLLESDSLGGPVSMFETIQTVDSNEVPNQAHKVFAENPEVSRSTILCVETEGTKTKDGTESVGEIMAKADPLYPEQGKDDSISPDGDVKHVEAVVCDVQVNPFSGSEARATKDGKAIFLVCGCQFA